MSIEPNIAGALDTTRSWVDPYRVNDKIQPSLLIRYATDTNYLQASDKSVMNLALPGTRLPNVIQWQVQESAEQLVQTATATCLNCMPVSKTSTTLSSTIPAVKHSNVIVSQWTQAPGDNGVLLRHDGNVPITSLTTLNGVRYMEQDVVYRLYDYQTFTVTSTAGFPDPSVPNDDDNDVSDISYYYSANGAVGAYFLLVDQEIIRVTHLSGSTFYIPAGGRGIAGTPIVQHNPGASITLLNFGPYTGDYVGYGYLNIDDYSPQVSLCRMGTCFTSYEGYGPMQGPMSHDVNYARNYAFTGYWFVTGVEPSLQADGTPMMQLDLQSGSTMLDKQKINPVLLVRMGIQLNQWKIGEESAAGSGTTIWGDADISRKVPSQWINYTSWDPSRMNSYPLTISVEFAQNKDFLEHVQSTNFGQQCLICRQDVADWLKTHQGAGGSLGDLTGNPQNVDAENRIVGKHIYQESIRVLRAPAGPLKTYIALMATMAMASWDHPAYGSELSQMFTKIPNKLFDALRNIHTGLCFNGQLSINIEDAATNETFDWFTPGYSDEIVISNREPLVAPFKSQYDQVPFTQPMQDLADVNGASLWFTREGYPVFVPMFFSFRPNGTGYKTYSGFATQDGTKKLAAQTSEWHMSYGGSIAEYSSSIDADQIFTVCFVTGNGAFDGSTIQIQGAGTGLISGRRMMYSSMGGNTDGLAMTSGVTQGTTVSLDNVVLGLSWDTNPASWGVEQQINDPGHSPTDVTSDSGNIYVLNGKPPLYQGQVPIGGSSSAASNGHSYQHNANAHSSAVKKVQQTLSFFQIHRYVTFIYKGKQQFGVTEDGTWHDETTQALINLQQYINTQGSSIPTGLPIRTDGNYDQATYKAINTWLTNNALYIQTDVWWYAFNMRPWAEYVAAVTGVPVVLKGDTLSNTPGTYAIDDTGTQQKVAKWLEDTFSKTLVNVANRTVDASINKATVRSISSNMADPRVIPGDTIWLNIPGYLGTQTTPPYTNGMYLLQVSRSMDLLQGSYTATYSGCRYAADHGVNFQTGAINGAYDFCTQAGDH